MESRRLSDNVIDLSDNVRSYIRLRLDLLKVTLTEKLSLITSAFLLSVIFFILFLFITMFISLAFILWFREHAGPMYVGALIVAGFYMVVGLAVYILRHRIFVDPLVSKISEILAEEDEDESN